MTDADAAVFTLRETVKLVVWDLDETFWKGTLSEGGVELIEDNAAVVRELNRRGIVSSICSKNDYAAARQRLETAGLWDEFVFPRIGWMPKGQAIAQLIDDIQLLPPNVLFIDDRVGNLREAEFFAAGLQTAGPEIIPRLLDLPQVKARTTASSRGLSSIGSSRPSKTTGRAGPPPTKTSSALVTSTLRSALTWRPSVDVCLS